jgi:hypothetical protein
VIRSPDIAHTVDAILRIQLRKIARMVDRSLGQPTLARCEHCARRASNWLARRRIFGHNLRLRYAPSF